MQPQSPIVLLVRHGRTALNKAKNSRLRAWENPPLDRRGQLDARLAAQLLRKFNPQMVYSSDLVRDNMTGQIISEDLGNIPWEMDYAARTADMGELSGMLDEEAAPLVLKWYQQPWWPAPSGESNNDFLARWYPWFDLKFDLAKNVESFCPTVIVSHGRNLAAIHARAEMIPQWEALMPFPGGVMGVYLDEIGRQKVDFLTETEPIQEDR